MSRRRTATVTGSPGQHARLKGLLLATWPIFFAMLIAGYLLRAALPMPEIPQQIAGILFLVLAVALAALINSGQSKLLDFLKGAQGEETVARELAFLPEDYRVFNCIESGKEALLPSNGDYDHVVIGPTGIFVVETKNWSGTITVEDGSILYNGTVPDRPPLAQVKTAAKGMKSRISEACDEEVEVKPIICFATDTLKGGTTGTTGVVVCNLSDLNSVITDATASDPVPSHIQKNAAVFLNGLIC